jgi:DNA-binding NarL/FixJ family response regulator
MKKFRLPSLTLKLDNTQPLLIPLTQDTISQEVQRITVHLAISDNDLENSILSLLGRNPRFLVVKGSMGYDVESDVRLIDERPNPNENRNLDEQMSPKLIYIGFDDSEKSLSDAARAGAWAFVSKGCDLSELEDSICAIIESDGSPLLKTIATSESGSAALLSDLSAVREDLTEDSAEQNPLTPEEIAILTLVARGEPSKKIGVIVGLAEQTIKNYVVKIFTKTHTQNRAHAAALAAQRGWLSSLDHE